MRVEFVGQYGVYRIVNLVNGRLYIGQTGHFLGRANQHFEKLQSGKHSNRRLQIDWAEFGHSKFLFQSLLEEPSEEKRRGVETKLYVSSPTSYNQHGYHYTRGEDRFDKTLGRILKGYAPTGRPIVVETLMPDPKVPGIRLCNLMSHPKYQGAFKPMVETERMVATERSADAKVRAAVEQAESYHVKAEAEYGRIWAKANGDRVKALKRAHKDEPSLDDLFD